MGYNDDEYNERLKPVELVSDIFSEKVITDVLVTAGLISENSLRYSGNMERLVFVFGNDNEVYSSSEIRFTEQINQVYMYSDYSKSLKQGNMVCRVIAAKIDEEGHGALTACVAFEKIVDKALDGFNVFLLVTDECVHFGCRIFEKNGKYDCALSNPIKEESQFERVLDEFTYTTDVDSFMDYYGQIRYIITSDQYNSPNYEDMIIRRKGMQLSYFEELDAISKVIGVDFSREKARYWNVFNGETETSFISLLEEVNENLSFIKSNRVNTYEMLFEADEMMRQADATEVEHEKIALALAQEHSEKEDVQDDEARSLLDDPEEMIRLLKKRRGF